MATPEEETLHHVLDYVQHVVLQFQELERQFDETLLANLELSNLQPPSWLLPCNPSKRGTGTLQTPSFIRNLRKPRLQSLSNTGTAASVGQASSARDKVDVTKPIESSARRVGIEQDNAEVVEASVADLKDSRTGCSTDRMKHSKNIDKKWSTVIQMGEKESAKCDVGHVAQTVNRSDGYKEIMPAPSDYFPTGNPDEWNNDQPHKTSEEARVGKQRQARKRERPRVSGGDDPCSLYAENATSQSKREEVEIDARLKPASVRGARNAASRSGGYTLESCNNSTREFQRMTRSRTRQLKIADVCSQAAMCNSAKATGKHAGKDVDSQVQQPHLSCKRLSLQRLSSHADVFNDGAQKMVHRGNQVKTASLQEDLEAVVVAMSHDKAKVNGKLVGKDCEVQQPHLEVIQPAVFMPNKGSVVDDAKEKMINDQSTIPRETNLMQSMPLCVNTFKGDDLAPRTVCHEREVEIVSEQEQLRAANVMPHPSEGFFPGNNAKVSGDHKSNNIDSEGQQPHLKAVQFSSSDRCKGSGSDDAEENMRGQHRHGEWGKKSLWRASLGVDDLAQAMAYQGREMELVSKQKVSGIAVMPCPFELPLSVRKSEISVQNTGNDLTSESEQQHLEAAPFDSFMSKRDSGIGNVKDHMTKGWQSQVVSERQSLQKVPMNAHFSRNKMIICRDREMESASVQEKLRATVSSSIDSKGQQPQLEVMQDASFILNKGSAIDDAKEKMIEEQQPHVDCVRPSLQRLSFSANVFKEEFGQMMASQGREVEMVSNRELLKVGALSSSQLFHGNPCEKAKVIGEHTDKEFDSEWQQPHLEVMRPDSFIPNKDSGIVDDKENMVDKEQSETDCARKSLQMLSLDANVFKNENFAQMMVCQDKDVETVSDQEVLEDSAIASFQVSHDNPSKGSFPGEHAGKVFDSEWQQPHLEVMKPVLFISNNGSNSKENMTNNQQQHLGCGRQSLHRASLHVDAFKDKVCAQTTSCQGRQVELVSEQVELRAVDVESSGIPHAMPFSFEGSFSGNKPKLSEEHVGEDSDSEVQQPHLGCDRQSLQIVLALPAVVSLGEIFAETTVRRGANATIVFKPEEFRTAIATSPQKSHDMHSADHEGSLSCYDGIGFTIDDRERGTLTPGFNAGDKERAPLTPGCINLYGRNSIRTVGQKLSNTSDFHCFRIEEETDHKEKENKCPFGSSMTKPKGRGALSLATKSSAKKRGTERSVLEESNRANQMDSMFECSQMPCNLVSNMTSFLHFVQQKPTTLPCLNGKREVKVKALKAAEAAKIQERKKEHERELRKLEFARREKEKVLQGRANEDQCPTNWECKEPAKVVVDCSTKSESEYSLKNKMMMGSFPKIVSDDCPSFGVTSRRGVTSRVKHVAEVKLKLDQEKARKQEEDQRRKEEDWKKREAEIAARKRKREEAEKKEREEKRKRLEEVQRLHKEQEECQRLEMEEREQRRKAMEERERERKAQEEEAKRQRRIERKREAERRRKELETKATSSKDTEKRKKDEAHTPFTQLSGNSDNFAMSALADWERHMTHQMSVDSQATVSQSLAKCVPIALGYVETQIKMVPVPNSTTRESTNKTSTGQTNQDFCAEQSSRLLTSHASTFSNSKNGIEIPGDTPINNGVQTYEISPYKNFSDEEDEDAENIPSKAIPLWARKEFLGPRLLRQQYFDPDEIFSSDKTCSLEESLSTSVGCVLRRRNHKLVCCRYPRVHKMKKYK